MSYRSMSGLGALETTKTGIAFHVPITCVTQGEHDEAASKCQLQELRGLGATYRNIGTMGGRLSSYEPCHIMQLPVCPKPTCIDTATVGTLFNCLAGKAVNPDFDCKSLVAAYLYGLPYCSRPVNLPEIPKCYSQDELALRSYCSQYGASGPDKTKNALCWLAMHDKAYWDAALKVPECPRPPVLRAAPVPVTSPPVLREAPRPAPAPVPTPVLSPAPTYPVVTTTPVAPTAPPSYRQTVPESEPDMTPSRIMDEEPPVESSSEEPDKEESSMMGMWGILALVAVAGGGYYMYRRYKR